MFAGACPQKPNALWWLSTDIYEVRPLRRDHGYTDADSHADINRLHIVTSGKYRKALVSALRQLPALQSISFQQDVPCWNRHDYGSDLAIHGTALEEAGRASDITVENIIASRRWGSAEITTAVLNCFMTLHLAPNDEDKAMLRAFASGGIKPARVTRKTYQNLGRCNGFAASYLTKPMNEPQPVLAQTAH